MHSFAICSSHLLQKPIDINELLRAECTACGTEIAEALADCTACGTEIAEAPIRLLTEQIMMMAPKVLLIAKMQSLQLVHIHTQGC